MSARRAALAWAMWTVACGAGEGEGGLRVEGDGPGECTDGVDNDSDGSLDCMDPDCDDDPACQGLDTDVDTDLPYTGPPPTVIDRFPAPGCADPGWWSFEAETTGWTNGANRVDAWETGALPEASWNEGHPLPSVEARPGFERDFLYAVLTADAMYRPGEATAWACGIDDDPAARSNLYLVRVHDSLGNFADCAWGVDRHAPPDVVERVVAGEFLEQNTVPDRDQLSVDCTTFTFP